MFTQLKSKKSEIAISRGDNPKDCLLKGIDSLGGFSKFIDEGDQVFIKFNLSLPVGFPIIPNLDVLQTLIISCKNAGARKVYLGSFPIKELSIKEISDLLNLKDYFQTFGAELAFLDNSDTFDNKEIDLDQLKKIKYDSHTIVQVKDKEFLVPNLVLNSDKFILINQINVNPLFKLNLSLLNLYSIIPPKYQENQQEKPNTELYLSKDQYIKDYISNIYDIFTIKQPILTINDLYYTLEGAGPYIYKDSKLKKTNLMVLGNDIISVDLITLKLLNIEINESELIQQAQNNNIVVPEISNIRILGEKIEEANLNVKLCASKLEDIKVQNCCINSGKYCSGCFKVAYHLLNSMKTYMGKDLKYSISNAFLVGEKPIEPKKVDNVILFGDCAIKTTMDYGFRKKIVEHKKGVTRDVKKKLKKGSKNKKKKKVKEKPNKNILNLPGCPPDFFNCLDLILKYYGSKNVPNLKLNIKMSKYWIEEESINKLKIWEAL